MPTIIEVNVATGARMEREMTAAEIAALPAEPAAPAVPRSVSRFQARAALLNAGLLESVEQMMSSPDTPALARLAWTDAQEFRRTSPTVAAMAGALGLSDAQIDDLFIAAATIDA